MSRPEVLEFVLEEFASRAARDVAFDEMAAFSIARFVDEEPSLGAKWLREHGEKMREPEDKLWRASDEARQAHREARERYKTTAAGKASYQRWKAKLRRRTVLRKKQRRYAATGKRAAAQARYWASAKGKAARKRRPKHDALFLKCRELGLPVHTVRTRIARGWSVDKALSTPVQAKRRAA